ELNMELALKDEEINKLKLYSTKLKYQNKNLEDKLDTKIDYDKARIKELDDLSNKIKEKEDIIEDKHDQVKYLRSLIDDYKSQITSNTENLEIQIRKISKTYEGLLEQKDRIIEKQDETIDNLIKSKEEIIKSNKTNVISLKLQNEKYQEIIEKLTKTN
ncbi:MAG: glycosyl transferase, partial [Methanobrevibacter sp.]|nr:glycosyl transferase [Methanobrevibacter sp.]